MQAHTKIYFDHFQIDYDPVSGWHDYIKCEIPNCSNEAVDIHHIEPRGMGGDPQGKKNDINNLMGICREHHEEFGDKEEYTDVLLAVHFYNMNKHEQGISY